MYSWAEILTGMIFSNFSSYIRCCKFPSVLSTIRIFFPRHPLISRSIFFSSFACIHRVCDHNKQNRRLEIYTFERPGLVLHGKLYEDVIYGIHWYTEHLVILSVIDHFLSCQSYRDFKLQRYTVEGSIREGTAALSICMKLQCILPCSLSVNSREIVSKYRYWLYAW